MRKPTNLTNNERHRIGCELIENSKNFKPFYGKITELGLQFNVSRRTIYEIWRVAKQQREDGLSLSLDSRLKGKIGCEPIPFPIAKILATKCNERATLDSFAIALGVSRSTIYKWCKQKKILSHTSAIHPQLTNENKLICLNFVISKLYFDRLLNGLKFKSMDNDIHIDEKHFFMTKLTARYYLAEGEEAPYRSCKHKSHIQKVMFMAAVSRPIYAENGDVIFDGKIGIFPFVTRKPAPRSSKNRPKGTMETKALTKISREITRTMLLNNIIPAIKSKWPKNASKVINIQQDNAPPHIKGNDQEFTEAATSDGFDISLTQQPANSPDLNILDLRFFRSIQSLQLRKPAKNLDELIANVESAWAEQKVDTLNDVWLSLQACMLEVMKRMGHNDYKLPHLGKKALRREGILPRDLTSNEDLVKECIEYLSMVGQQTNLEELIRDMGIILPN